MERFVALLAASLTILGLLAASLRVLIGISFKMGQLVERFADHVKSASEIHDDQEKRIRGLEKNGQPPAS